MQRAGAVKLGVMRPYHRATLFLTIGGFLVEVTSQQPPRIAANRLTLGAVEEEMPALPQDGHEENHGPRLHRVFAEMSSTSVAGPVRFQGWYPDDDE
jgi:hypothetical protein